MPDIIYIIHNILFTLYVTPMTYIMIVGLILVFSNKIPLIDWLMTNINYLNRNTSGELGRT